MKTRRRLTIKISTLLNKIDKCDKQNVIIAVHLEQSKYLWYLIESKEQLDKWNNILAYAVEINYWFGETKIYVSKKAYEDYLKENKNEIRDQNLLL